jgi:hypothetical protein
MQQFDKGRPSMQLFDRGTPSMQLLDRGTPAPPLFERGAQGTRPVGPPPPRLRSMSGDQGTKLERNVFGPVTSQTGKEKRRSFHQYPVDSFPEPKFVPPALPERNSLKLQQENSDLKRNQEKRNDMKANLNDLKNEEHKQRKLSDEKLKKLKNENSDRKISEMNDVKRKESRVSILNGARPKEIDFPTKPENIEKPKRWSGHFNNDMSVSAKPNDRETDRKRQIERDRYFEEPTSKAKPGHSKLTKGEEKYIADLLKAKICSPEKARPKLKAPEDVKDVSKTTKLTTTTASSMMTNDVEEERKKGAIRKRPPPLQEPASRPQSSFIMDDVLYTSRYHLK